MTDRLSLVYLRCTTSGQETERVHSYNPGARTGHDQSGKVMIPGGYIFFCTDFTSSTRSYKVESFCYDQNCQDFQDQDTIKIRTFWSRLQKNLANTFTSTTAGKGYRVCTLKLTEVR